MSTVYGCVRRLESRAALTVLSAAAVALSACATATRSQEPAAPIRDTLGHVDYRITFDNAAHHEARVTVTFHDVPDGALEIRMSRTSPGRYALHEFAKNVYDVEVTDGVGRTLAVERPNLHQWNVPGHDGTVRISYTLYGDRWDGTYAAIDRTGALLNMPASFMWARGLEERPVRIRFAVPAGHDWDVATQLAPTDDPAVFTAPDRDYFLDSPTLLADLRWYRWTRTSGGRDYEIRFALHSDSRDSDVEAYMEMVEKVFDEEIAIYGELPRFDYGTYTFLGAYLPWASGDGMEHRNSTVLTRAARLPENALRVLGTVAHEFFHAWNVERIRPATLEPFDFEAANVSRELWFAEGFTSYYDDLAIRRAGIIGDRDFGARMGSLVNQVAGSPGRQHFSPVGMSRQAPFVDAAVSVDPTNRRNTFISYYTWGAAVALALDLSLRADGSATLDEFMRRVWEAHGRTFDPYDVQDLERILGSVWQDPARAREFFDRYVRGSEVPDYQRLFAQAGFRVVRTNPGRASLGDLALRASDGQLRLVAGTLEGSPAYRAGLDRGDRLLALDGRPVSTAADVREALSAIRPGDVVEITFESRDGRHVVRVEAEEDGTRNVVPIEQLGEEPSATQRAFRQRWLSSLAGAGP